jgi:uncharacterized protein (DUF2267 family)
MDYERFIAIVSAGRSDRDEADRAARATLQTLAERIHGSEARDLAAELPPELAPALNRALGTGPEAFDVDEFVRRIAAREGGVPLGAAERDARAVFAALALALSRKEWADMTAELPREFASFYGRGLQIDTIAADEFLRRVADRTQLGEDGARRATEAVLELLAERIAGGEVEDLFMRRPVELHPPLRRGSARSAGRARRMALADFLRGVAQRERVAPPLALVHARAVFQTLREAVGGGELLDVTVQLPDEYVSALVR